MSAASSRGSSPSGSSNQDGSHRHDHQHYNKKQQQSSKPSMYSMIMTGVNFVTFLISLLFVELRYTLARAYNKYPTGQSRLPVWLQHVLYRQQPYNSGRARCRDSDCNFYYHSKQKKLMRMEATEALEMRNSVMVLLGVSAVAAMGGCWFIITLLVRGLMASRLASSIS